MKGMYIIDQSHSFVDFKLRHLLTDAKGSLAIDTAYFDLNDDLATSKVFMQLDVKSIDTKNKERNEHLLKDDFFDATKYPKITFNGSSIRKSEKANFAYVITGDLKMKDVTKPVDLHFNYVGHVENEYAKEQAHSFAGMMEINRTDFHVGTPSTMVGDKVAIDFSVETYMKK